MNICVANDYGSIYSVCRNHNTVFSLFVVIIIRSFSHLTIVGVMVSVIATSAADMGSSPGRVKPMARN